MFCGLAFGGGSDNPHLLHNHEADQVVYTGTHDNDTVKYCIFSQVFHFGSYVSQLCAFNSDLS